MPRAATMCHSENTGFRAWSPAGSVRQTIEAGRIVASQAIKGGGKLYIRIFPQKSVTAIPAETRMGKGKGEIEYWAAVVKPGTILYEVSGLGEEAARTMFARVAQKMPVNCRFVHRRPTV